MLGTLLAATAWVTHLISRAGERMSSSFATHQADEAGAAWVDCLQRYEIAVNAVRALFAASELVEEGELRLFTQSLLQEHYRCIQEIAYVADPLAREPLFIERFGGADTTLRLGSDDLRAALAEARARNGLVLHVPVAERNPTELVAVVPVGPNGAMQSGWIVASLSLEALLAEATSARLEGVIALELASKGVPLARRADGGHERTHAALRRTHELSHLDRDWSLLVDVAPPIEARVYRGLVPYVGATGVLIGIFAFVVIGKLNAARDRLSTLVGDLRQARLAADAASEAKLLFLANMSHEIRTPLNGVLGTSALLAHRRLAPADRTLAEAVQSSARELSERIELILDFVKAETDELDLETVELDPRRELEAVQGLLLPWAHGKRLALRCELAPDLPAVILADSRRLRQVLFQLAGNAVKFTEEGEVVLRATCLQGREPDREATLRFEVQDTGPGIPASDRERILEAFSKRDETMSRRHGGVGLGLSLSRRLVRLMGGELEVASAHGRGTCVGFTLRGPVRCWSSGANAGAAQETERAADSLRVLVVEDNLVSRRVTESILAKAGHRVRNAENGAVAVRAVLEERFDVILMDCQMPEMDGYEATERIRSTETDGRVPIIALTAHDLKGDRERCLRAGMDDYLSKPVQPARLLERIRAWTDPSPAASTSGV